MLSDEEKKAYDNLIMLKYFTIEKEDKQAIDTILNLIETQQKEIEELKAISEYREKIIKGLGLKTIPETIKGFKELIENNNKKWEDKIKEILGIEEDINSEKLLSLLQTIVDENARLEDVEDRKVQIEYKNVFNKGVKSVEEKIKARIEEARKRYNDLHTKHLRDCGIAEQRELAKIEFGESLLKEE